MATYEVLEPGGHARLVSDTKGYANRASGVGTTQIADESVTSAKLADDVTDTLDNVESFTDPMNKNGLHGTIAEGAVLTADDAYPMPPRDVDVFGKSTQAGTPTPDAPVSIKSVDDLTLNVCGKNLFDPSHLLEASGWTVSNGVYTGWSSALHVPFVNGYPLPPFVANTRYTLSFDFDYDGDEGVALVVNFAYADGTQGGGYVTAKNSHQALTSSAGKTLSAIGFSYGTNRVVRLSNVQVEQASAATAYAPYVGASVSIPLDDHSLRSLPNSTRDTLTLSYQGPSTEHEGWGVFSKTLVQNVGEIELDGTQYIILYNWRPSETAVGWAYNSSSVPALVVNSSNTNNLRSNKLTGVYYDTIYSNGGNYASLSSNPNYTLFIKTLNASLTTRDAISAWLAENPVIVHYPLATPITHDLGTVELPILSNPLTAWADGGSAQPTLSMSYERDVNIVISNMMSVIADAATS